MKTSFGHVTLVENGPDAQRTKQNYNVNIQPADCIVDVDVVVVVELMCFDDMR